MPALPKKNKVQIASDSQHFILKKACHDVKLVSQANVVSAHPFVCGCNSSVTDIFRKGRWGGSFYIKACN